MKPESLRNWKSIERKLKERYPELTDADLAPTDGREGELLARIQRRTGRSREEIESFLEQHAGGSTADATGASRERRPTIAQSSRETTASPSQPGDESMQQRTQPPGEAGLANEKRPGLGTRSSEQHPPAGEPGADPQREMPAPAVRQDDENVSEGATTEQQPDPAATPEAPTPHEPQEQRSDSLEQEQQRSTGVSGKSAG